MKGVEKLLPLIEENDYVIHLGDGFSEARKLLSAYPEKAYICAGNCDFSVTFPSEGVLEVEKLRIFYCHGHRYDVKTGLARLAFEAKRRGCDIALYGHTHTPKVSEVDGVTLINPGSARYSVDLGGSYCYLVIHENKATPVLVGEGMV
jgi:putative phosphoesterase